MAWSERGIVGPFPARRILNRWENGAGAEDPTVDFAHGWEVKPSRREVRTRATDEAGNVWPNEGWWNDLGYLNNGVAGHLIDVL